MTMKTDFQRHQEFVARVGKFFKIGERLRCVAHGGKPFDGKESTVESFGVGMVYLTGPLPNGRTIRTYLDRKSLEDIRPTDYGFELWVDGEPYFGYERVEAQEVVTS